MGTIRNAKMLSPKGGDVEWLPLVLHLSNLDVKICDTLGKVIDWQGSHPYLLKLYNIPIHVLQVLVV